ncbi:MAG TPA: hypothetical protein H9705_07820 [Candidatus Fusicatenibacter intestinigallinarum]|uniref:Uncharacterized protein n=1 Tax=Candidatus Fusicatenibacter intestinigallinarum TaxID=2838598 RepID=A0A9D2SM75_9FIRM|nr:hypothetical protein [Candidatus Fusicatenibacter intestinigallinarum]
MKMKRIGTFLKNMVCLVLLVFYAMALTVIIGMIQLGTYAVTKIVNKCRISACVKSEGMEQQMPREVRRADCRNEI